MKYFEENLMRLDLINRTMKQIIEMVGYTDHFDWSTLKGVKELSTPDELFELDEMKQAMKLIFTSNSRYELNRVIYRLLFEEYLNISERNLMMKNLYMNEHYRKRRVVANTLDYAELTDILFDLSVVIREFLRDNNCEVDPMPEKLCRNYEAIDDRRRRDCIDEFLYIICDYYPIYRHLDYPKRPVFDEYELRRNENGEYCTDREVYKHRAEVEFLYTDESGIERWAIDTIVGSVEDEFHLWHYPDIALEGLKIRYRCTSFDDL